MDVTDVLRRLLRLRWAVVGVLVVALIAALIGYTSAGSSRQSRAAVVIVPPKVANVAGGDNPLLNLDNNLAQLAVVLSAALGSQTVVNALAKDGGTADFDVSTVTGDNPSFSQLSPQLVFTITGSSDAVTMRTANALIEQSRSALDQLQERAGVPASSRASVVEVTPPTPPIVVSGGRLRSAGALGVGIVVVGLMLVLAVDALRRRRSGVPVPVAVPAPVGDVAVVTPALAEQAEQPAAAEPDVAPAADKTAPPVKRALRTTPPAKKAATKTAMAPGQNAPAKAARKAPAKKGLGAPKTPPVKKATGRAVQRDLFASLRAGDDVLPAAKAELLPDPPEPVAAEPVAPEPVAEPVAAEPTATEPTATEPTATEPTATEPTATEPTATEPTATEPTVETPAAETPVEPSAPEPIAPEPSAPEPTAPGPSAPEEAAAAGPPAEPPADTAADEPPADTTGTMVKDWSPVSLNGAPAAIPDGESPVVPEDTDATTVPDSPDSPDSPDGAAADQDAATPPARKTARRSAAAGSANRRTGTPSRRARAARKTQG